MSLSSSFNPPFSNIKSTLEGFAFDQLFFWQVFFGPATFAPGGCRKERSLLRAPPTCHAQQTPSDWCWAPVAGTFRAFSPLVETPSTILSSLMSFQLIQRWAEILEDWNETLVYMCTHSFCYKCHICFLCFYWSPLGSILLCYVQNLHTKLLLSPKGILISFIVSI